MEAKLTMMLLAGVMAGGAIGAVARFWLSRWSAIAFNSSIPATLTVNFTGAFALGITVAVVNNGLSASFDSELYTWIELGVLGGFTTFSTLAAEARGLLQKSPFRAFGYLSLSIVGGLVCMVAGFSVADLWFPESGGS